MEGGGVTPKKMFDMRNFNKGLIVILENAYLEAAKIGTEYKLLNSDDHVSFLSKKKRDPSQARPDIAHQCLMTLMDSPLNKAGLLKVYVRTAQNVIIDVNPKLRIPRTFKRFSGLIVQLLHKLSIKAEGIRGEPVLKLVKGPVTRFFPHNATVIGTSYSSDKLVDIFEYVPKLFESTKVSKPRGGEDDDEDSKEPNLKKVKTEKEGEDSDEEEEEKEKEVKDSFKLEAEEEEERENSDDEEESENENDIKVETLDDVPQNFDVKEEFRYTGKGKENKVVVFVVGAMSHGKINIDYSNDEISISQYPMSGSGACGKICASFEKYFGVI